MTFRISTIKNYLMLVLIITTPLSLTGKEKPKNKVLKLGVIGLVHDHVSWILNRQKEDVKIVGVVETNKNAILNYKKKYSLPDSIFFKSYKELYKNTSLDAVSAFNPTKEHLNVVRYFAPKGIPIMVEKPMATSIDDAQEMADLVKKYKVPLLINYETSWYESTYEAKKLFDSGKFGSITKMVFNTGHPGPQEIGCTPEFLEWLTDPVLNGAGALTDFGCYGANIATWMLKGQTPTSVSCIAKQTKPDRYPNVDDDTTIILEYPNKQVVIQASWNWSHNRKDMQIYGSNGYVDCQNANTMIILENEVKGPKKHLPNKISQHLKDPFRLLYEVVFENKTIEPYSLYSVENNLIVSKILSLAKVASRSQTSQKW